MGDAKLTVIINYRFSSLAGVYHARVCLGLSCESYVESAAGVECSRPCSEGWGCVLAKLPVECRGVSCIFFS